MKFLEILSIFAAAGSAMASSCHPDYECCKGCQTILTDDEGNWGAENGQWCFIDEKKCSDSIGKCKFEKIGYPCCSHCNVILTDESGKWGAENGQWCGIPDNCGASEPTEPSQPSQPTKPTKKSENFFDNELYVNDVYAKKIEGSLKGLSPELQAKARRVEKVSTAVWLAWEGAPDEVAPHLEAAGKKTVTFIMYMIPTRDCGSLASAGGAKDLNKYKGYVNSIAATIKKYPDAKVNMIIEPDTLGNLITGDTEACKNVHDLHKTALSYAINVFGALDNVNAYLDCAHHVWLGWGAPKVAALIKELLDNAPDGDVRGFSTNVSNYQPIDQEYEYHEKLNAALEDLGITGKKFIVDTSRSGVDITEAFAVNQTWCNLSAAGLGEPSRGSPDPENKPLLDAYMWLKPPAESDGSDKGSRADPVCAREDSFPGAPDAGSWFEAYFISMLEKSPFYKASGETTKPTEEKPTEEKPTEEKPAEEKPAECKFEAVGFKCCTTTCEVYYTDDTGDWGVENNDWCGIPDSCKK